MFQEDKSLVASMIKDAIDKLRLELTPVPKAAKAVPEDEPKPETVKTKKH